MKIALNSLPLTTEHKNRGIGFYTKNLLEGLQKQPNIEVQEFSYINEVKLADIVHYPCFDLFKRTLPIAKKFPTIVTIHDVAPLIFPQHYPPGIKGKINFFFQKLSLSNVRTIITDSRSSKADIEKYLGVDRKKIYPIYLAASGFFRPVKNQNFLEEARKKYCLPKVFSIFVGSVNWNKNILNMVEASLQADLDIVLVGKDFENRDNLGHPERRSYAKFLEKYAINKRVHILGYVDNTDLTVIINLAQVLLLPSYDEGFGLPILEAQACGVPVVTSNISSMPEVAGKGALFVNPYKVEEIEIAIETILTDRETRDGLISKGFNNCRKFSWEKTVEQTLAVYNKFFKK